MAKTSTANQPNKIYRITDHARRSISVHCQQCSAFVEENHRPVATTEQTPWSPWTWSFGSNRGMVTSVNLIGAAGTTVPTGIDLMVPFPIPLTREGILIWSGFCCGRLYRYEHTDSSHGKLVIYDVQADTTEIEGIEYRLNQPVNQPGLPRSSFLFQFLSGDVGNIGGMI